MLVKFQALSTDSFTNVTVKNDTTGAAITGSPYTSTHIADGWHTIEIDNANITDGALYFITISGIMRGVFPGNTADGAVEYVRDAPIDLSAVLDALETLQPALTGPWSLTFTVRDQDNNLLSDVLIRVSKDTEWESALTVSGAKAFALSNGTWSYTARKTGYTSSVGTKSISGANATQSITLTRTTVTPSDPGFVTGMTTVYDPEGQAEADVAVWLKLVALPTGSGSVFDGVERSSVSDSEGAVEFVGMIPGATYAISRDGGTVKEFTVPSNASGTYTLPNFFGAN